MGSYESAEHEDGAAKKGGGLEKARVSAIPVFFLFGLTFSSLIRICFYAVFLLEALKVRLFI